MGTGECFNEQKKYVLGKWREVASGKNMDHKKQQEGGEKCFSIEHSDMRTLCFETQNKRGNMPNVFRTMQTKLEVGRRELGERESENEENRGK